MSHAPDSAPRTVQGSAALSHLSEIVSESPASCSRHARCDWEWSESKRDTNILHVQYPDDMNNPSRYAQPSGGFVPDPIPAGRVDATGQDMDRASVADLVYLARLQKYHHWKRIQVENRLHVVRTSWAVRDRLIQSGNRLLGDLAKALRSEDQTCFLSLFQAFRTVNKACEEYDMTECSSAYDGSSSRNTQSKTVLLGLCPTDNHLLLGFLRRIASDPDFVLRHLSALSNREFDALLRIHTPSETSVFKGYGTTQLPHSRMAPDVGPLNAFLGLGRHDFLSLLLQISGPYSGTAMSSSACHYWAKVCATLLSDQKPGADKFVSAVLNTWTQAETHIHSHALETWLLNVLREGHFLLEKPDKYSLRMRDRSRDGNMTEDTGSTDSFFTRSMNSLLKILKDSEANEALPTMAMKLGKAIVNELRGSEKQFNAAPYFLCTRWLFSSHLTKIVRNPESCGLLLSCHVSSTARRRILDELALRLQKLAFDVAYTWKHTASADPQLLDDMEAVVSLFRPHSSDIENQSNMRDSVDAVGVVALCPSDIRTLVHGFFPSSASDMNLSIFSLGGPTVCSSASSVSGLSLFRNVNQDGHFAPGERHIHTMNSETRSVFSAGQESRPQSPMPLQSPPDFSEANESNADEYSMICELGRICHDLSGAHGAGLEIAHEDPFSEHWVTLLDLEDIRWTPSEQVSGLDWTDIDGMLESHCIPHQVKTAICALPDHLDEQLGKNYRQTSKRAPHDIGVSGPCRPAYDLSTELQGALANAASNCQKNSLFAKARLFQQVLQWVRSSAGNEPVQGVLNSLFDKLGIISRRAIGHDLAVMGKLETQIDSIRMDQNLQLKKVQALAEVVSRLREKMWYISGVRFAGKYEDLFKVTSALKTMGLPVKPAPSKGQLPLRHRATGSALYEGLALKSESAILELLAATPAHGGPNKLSDKQISLTSDWLLYHGIENLCKGEERLHRFCHEVSRCTDAVVSDSIFENPLLWSSELFDELHCAATKRRTASIHQPATGSARERLRVLCCRRADRPSSSRLSPGLGGRKSPFSHGSPDTLGMETGFTMVDRNPMGYPRSCSPTLTNSTTGTIWSSFTSGEQVPSSVTSLPSHTHSRPLSDRSSNASLSSHHCQKAFVEDLKHNITGLILSDVGHLFTDGSETDLALWNTFDGRFANAISTSAFTDNDNKLSCLQPMDPPVDFADTLPQHSKPDDSYGSPESLSIFQQLLNKFEITPNPYEKLKLLHDIQSLNQAWDEPETSFESAEQHAGLEGRAHFEFVRTRNGEEQAGATDDPAVSFFRRLFLDSSMRPKTLFRDLQYIAALVPTSTLDNSDEGHAFWNATIAALRIKQQILRSMIEVADAIVAYHTLTRGHSFVSSAAQAERDLATFTSSRPNSAAAMENVAQYSMADAAELYLITAKEGDAAAQREVATLYLTHPEIMKRVIAPLTKAGDVFKGAASTAAAVDTGKGSKKGAGIGQQQQQQQDADSKYDLVTMAIARHWMELAANGGDELAKNTLRATDEIERIP